MGLSIPGLTINSNGSKPLKAGQTISFGVQPTNGPAKFGAPLPITNTGSVMGAKTSQGGTYAPSTGGQAAAPASAPSAPSGPNYGDELTNAFNQSKQALQNIIPTYDSDFNNYQNTVNDQISQAQSAHDQQVGDTNYRYGTALKQLLQNSADLKQRTQSTFSGLGSLDSSAFGDELLKQQQNDSDNTASLSKQQNGDISNIDNTFTNYKNNAQSQISSYQNEISRAKDGVQQAIANNDIQKAQSLADYANQLQGTINSFGSALSDAQGQGAAAINGIKSINGANFLNGFGQNLANQYNNGVSTYQIPGSSATGQGYISSGGLSDAQKKLLGLA